MRIQMSARQGGTAVAAACAIAEEKRVVFLVPDEDRVQSLQEDIVRTLKHIGLSSKNAAELVKEFLEIRVPGEVQGAKMSHYVIPDEI